MTKSVECTCHRFARAGNLVIHPCPLRGDSVKVYLAKFFTCNSLCLSGLFEKGNGVVNLVQSVPVFVLSVLPVLLRYLQKQRSLRLIQTVLREPPGSSSNQHTSLETQFTTFDMELCWRNGRTFGAFQQLPSRYISSRTTNIR